MSKMGEYYLDLCEQGYQDDYDMCMFIEEASKEANTTYQLSKEEEIAYNAYMEGNLCTKTNVHIDENINSSNGLNQNRLKLRKRSSKR